MSKPHARMPNTKNHRGTECGNKYQHKSKGGAKAHLRSLRKRGSNHGLQTYRCTFCNFWHVGHRQKPWNVKKKTKKRRNYG